MASTAGGSQVSPSKSSILDLSEPKKAVELGKEAQPNENAGDQLTRMKSSWSPDLTQARLQDRQMLLVFFSSVWGLFGEKRSLKSRLD